MHRSLAITALLGSTTVVSAAPKPLWVRQSQCSNSTFSAVTAQEWTDGMNPAWNLGNTLDAIPTEGSWNNPPVDFSTFDYVHRQGFRGVRIPVTWTDHFTSGSPSWNVDQTWLNRVEAVVDAVLSRDLNAVINVHHDATDWADVTAANANYTAIEERFYRLWYQVATQLACKSANLSFETINEPPGSTQQHYDELTKLQGLFIKAVGDAGGFNARRVLNLVGPSQDGALTSQFFVRPTNITNPWLIQYHYYSPYDFVFSAWGKTIWGSAVDQTAVESDIAHVRGNFTDVPLLIGEWDASPTNTETAARRKYNDFVSRTANKYNTSTSLWDNGADYLDRSSGTWRDQTGVDIITSATTGVSNSLGDSTTDAAATIQETSAYVFQRLGENVTDQALPWLFNGNTVTSIVNNATTLQPGIDYIVTSSDITFTAGYLSSIVGDTTGVLADLVVNFSAGAAYGVQIVQWDQPILATTSSSISEVPSGGELDIPITYNGLSKLAAVTAKTITGDYLVDTWTVYLGPLQQARTTYSNQWNFDASHVIITSGGVSAARAAGVDVYFTFEFYPREPGNAVNYTLAAN